MAVFRKYLFVFLALVALFTGAFTATLIGGKTLSASAAPAAPKANSKPSVYSVTVVVPDLGDGYMGYKCGAPPNGNFPPTTDGCLLGQIAVPNPPLNISCMAAPANQTGWRPCSLDGYGPSSGNHFLAYWDNGELQVFIGSNGSVTTGNYVISAIVA